jgi:predicted alpha/beta superfamily hydrolase
MKSVTFICLLTILVLPFCKNRALAQQDTCIFPAKKHLIDSDFSDLTREYWVSLPLRYDTTQPYPVFYVFDAEWRFNMLRHIIYDMGGNKKIPDHIVVGIPHTDWRNQRGIDLTFSHSRNEYDGEEVDSTLYDDSNSGGGALFYRYLTQELIPDVDKHYATNDQRILVGHSYGGYFASYIMSSDTFFSAYQIYDPSIWYNRGEVIEHLKRNEEQLKPANVFISFQPVPEYHKNKIRAFIETLKKYPQIQLDHKMYTDETHNSLFLRSFLDGIKFLYKNFGED